MGSTLGAADLRFCTCPADNEKFDKKILQNNIKSMKTWQKMKFCQHGDYHEEPNTPRTAAAAAASADPHSKLILLSVTSRVSLCFYLRASCGKCHTF